MPWILYDVLAAATYNVIDPSKAVVSCDLLKLNESRVICASPAPVNVDREVKVIDQVVDPITKAIVEEHILLHGRVQKYAQMTKGVTNNTYEYTIKELATELEKFRVHNGTNYVVNCSTQNTSLYAATIFVDSAWSIAGGVTNYLVQALQFRYMTGIAALNKIISELSAASAATPLYMWFNSSTKTVGWGEYRTDRTAGKNFTKGTYYNYKEEKTVRNQVAGVVIYGANSAYDGHYPDPLPGSQHDLAVYQYDTATSDAECADIAKAVYLTWCADPKRRIQFVLRPADTKVSGQYILEGDRIQVDGVNYTIIDMTYSPKEVLIGVNAGEDSVLYSLGDKLRPVAGTATGASEIVWSPGTQNLSSDGTTTADFILEISSLGDVSTTIPMNVEIGPYKIYGYPEMTGVTNAVLDTTTVSREFWPTSQSDVITLNSNGAYIPSTQLGNFLESNVIANGFVYALATVSFTIENLYEYTNPGWFWITCCHSYDNVNWSEGTYQRRIAIGIAAELEKHTGGAFAHPFKSYVDATYIVPGILTTTKLYVKWRLYYSNQGSPSASIDLFDISAMMNIIPRHSHSIQQSGLPNNNIKPSQVDNLVESSVTPPGSVTCQINSGTPFAVPNNSPVDILTGHGLASGRNIIKFTSSTVCTVTPSATYQMYG